MTVHQNNLKNVDHLVEQIANGIAAVKKDPSQWILGPNKLMGELSKVKPSVAAIGMQECYHEVFNIDNIEAKVDTKVEEDKKKDKKEK